MRRVVRALPADPGVRSVTRVTRLTDAEDRLLRRRFQRSPHRSLSDYLRDLVLRDLAVRTRRKELPSTAELGGQIARVGGAGVDAGIHPGRGAGVGL